MTTQEKRQALMAEALSWQNTGFEHGQCLKGVLADCSTFPASCYRHVGLFRPEIPVLPPDWFLHTRTEVYLKELLRYAVEFTPAEKTPEPGDFVLFKDVSVGAKVCSHGALVVEWGIRQRVIHAFPPRVMVSNVRTFPALAHKPMRFFDPFARVA